MYLLKLFLDLAQYYNLAVIKDPKHLPFGGKSLANVTTNNIRNDAGINHSTLNALHLQNHNQSMFQTDVDITTNTHRTFFNQSIYNENGKYHHFGIQLYNYTRMCYPQILRSK